MKLDKLEISALLGMQARNRELVFMMEQVKQQLTDLETESTELFSDIEARMGLEPGSIADFDVDVSTGELVPRQDDPKEFGSGGVASLTRENSYEADVKELKD